jgi:hypothetical protein
VLFNHFVVSLSLLLQHRNLRVLFLHLSDL